MKKRTVFSAVIAATIVAAYSGITPVAAEETTGTGVTKDETVYVFTDASGSVTNTIVSDWLKNESGETTITDKSDLTDIENVKGDETYSQGSDGSITWKAAGNDIYYRGNSSKQAPVTMKITYTLDGNNITAADAAGKSGKLTLNIKLNNSTFTTQSVDGAMKQVCVPIVAIAGVMMDSGTFTNITCDSGTLQSDAANQIVAAVMLPGMKQCLGSNLTGDLSSVNSYLKDEFTIEADVTNFKTPTILMTCSTSIDDLKEETKTTDLSSVMSDLDDLKSATNELISGAKSLYDGTVTLDNGASDLQSGAQQLADGLGTLNSNSDALNSGAQQIADGILTTANSQLNAAGLESVTWDNYADKISEYLGVTDAMRAAAKQQILSQVNQTLTSQGKSTIDESKLDLLLYMAAAHNDTSKDLAGNLLAQSVNATAAEADGQAVLNAQSDAGAIGTGDFTHITSLLAAARTEAAAATPTAEQLAATEASILTQIKTAAGNLIDDDTAKKVLYYSAANYGAAALSSANLGSSLAAVSGGAQVDMTLEATINMVTSVETAACQATIADASKTPDSTIYAGVVSELKTMNSSLDDSTCAVLITYAGEHYVSTDTLVNNLTSAAAVVSNANSVLTDQTESATAHGQQIIKGVLTSAVQSDSSTMGSLNTLLSTLNSVQTFVSGVNEYTAGVSTAYNGALQLKNGTDSLKSGTTELEDGAKDLYDGIQKYNTDGISKLTDSSDIKNLEKLGGMVEAVADKAAEYNNYSGLADGMDGKVVFIYKVAEVDAPEATATATADASSSDSSSSSNGFWNWLTSLFKK